MHNVLIGLHAAAGVVGFGVGVAALFQQGPRSWRYPVYFACLLLLVVFMVAVVVVDWPRLGGGTRFIYGALISLGLYMIWRGGHAGLRLRGAAGGWRHKYVNDIGFTLIALFDGFVIVAAVDLDAPVWAVVLIAVLGVAVGIWAIGRVRARLPVSTYPHAAHG